MQKNTKKDLALSCVMRYTFPVSNNTMEQYLDSNGNPLEVGHTYALVTYGENGITPDFSEWIKATWNGQQLVDEVGCTWNEWLNPKGAPSEDVMF